MFPSTCPLLLNLRCTNRKISLPLTNQKQFICLRGPLSLYLMRQLGSTAWRLSSYIDRMSFIGHLCAPPAWGTFNSRGPARARSFRTELDRIRGEDIERCCGFACGVVPNDPTRQKGLASAQAKNPLHRLAARVPCRAERFAWRSIADIAALSQKTYRDY